MIRISDALKEVISNNSFLEWGLSHGLLNISKTAAWIRPLVEARTKKEVSDSALSMGICRLMKRKKVAVPDIETMELINVNVHADLACLTYVQTSGVHQQVEKIFHSIKKQGGYITVTQGINEIMIVVQQDFLAEVEKTITADVKSRKSGLAALGAHFDAHYVLRPGMIYHIVQQLALQNVNIWELSSTYTELILYIEETDVKLAFDTLYRRFLRKV